MYHSLTIHLLQDMWVASKSWKLKIKLQQCNPGNCIQYPVISHNGTEYEKGEYIPVYKASLVAQWSRICLPMQETQVRTMGGEDLLEKEMAPHSSILAWEIPGTEEPGGLQSVVLQRVGHD